MPEFTLVFRYEVGAKVTIVADTQEAAEQVLDDQLNMDGTEMLEKNREANNFEALDRTWTIYGTPEEIEG